MRILRLVLWIGLVTIVLAGGYALRSFRLLTAPAQAHAQPVPGGDREIAWVSPSTSGSSWERFVAGVHTAVDEHPGLELDDSQAFPAQTTAIPEIAVRFPGGGRLWFRWYKLTNEVGLDKWVATLARREPAPLAFLGGGTSDRARDLALALEGQVRWQGDRPLLLLSTATAEFVDVEKDGEIHSRPLMDIYSGRSFRFCFSNRQMAEAVRQFVERHPDLRPHGNPYPALSAVGAAAVGPWAAWPLLASGGESPATVHVLEWEDDPYSVDLATHFKNVFLASAGQTNVFTLWIKYSVGGYFLPNHWEAEATRWLLRTISAPEERQLLVLPCMDRPARRILRGLSGVAPLEVRELVAVSGDSIPFNSVYRDRDIAWNIQDMPVPLVFFCHQNPVAWPNAPVTDPRVPERGPPAASSTDDQLFNADIARLLLAAAGPTTNSPQLAASADILAHAFRNRAPAFFTDADTAGKEGAAGNRRGGKGEYVVYLKPLFDENKRVMAAAIIEVWVRQSEGPDGWVIKRTLWVDSGHELEGPVRGGF